MMIEFLIEGNKHTYYYVAGREDRDAAILRYISKNQIKGGPGVVIAETPFHAYMQRERLAGRLK